jgi:hypothetical protein
VTVTLGGERDFADVIELRVLRLRDYHTLFHWF